MDEAMGLEIVNNRDCLCVFACQAEKQDINRENGRTAGIYGEVGIIAPCVDP
jgi:hypothetical protein